MSHTRECEIQAQGALMAQAQPKKGHYSDNKRDLSLSQIFYIDVVTYDCSHWLTHIANWNIQVNEFDQIWEGTSPMEMELFKIFTRQKRRGTLLIEHVLLISTAVYGNNIHLLICTENTFLVIPPTRVRQHTEQNTSQPCSSLILSEAWQDGVCCPGFQCHLVHSIKLPASFHNREDGR